jgi:hypothetical protein
MKTITLKRRKKKQQLNKLKSGTTRFAQCVQGAVLAVGGVSSKTHFCGFFAILACKASSFTSFQYFRLTKVKILI